MRVSVLLVLLMVLACFSFEALALDKAANMSNASTRSLFEARYAAMKAAMASRDGQAISELLAPDFISEDVSGQKLSGDKMVEQVLALPKDPSKVSNTTILSITVNDNIATVDQRYDMKTTKATQDGSKRDVELISVSTDTWVQSNHKWLLQRTVTEQTDYIISGQNVLHKVRPAGQ